MVLQFYGRKLEITIHITNKFKKDNKDNLCATTLCTRRMTSVCELT